MNAEFDEDWPLGLYEMLVDRELYGHLEHTVLDRSVIKSIDNEDFPYAFARHISRAVENMLLTTKGKETRIKLAASILHALCNASEASEVDPRNFLLLNKDYSAAHYLAEIKAKPEASEIIRPSTPLCSAALLTNAEHDVSLQAELSKEFESASRIDAIIAFVKWSGIQTLSKQLKHLYNRGIPIRIITTTYTGATEQRALDRLVNEYGAHIKVNYQTKSTRLHAKSWIIYRDTGYHTAFIGSSNLSHSAIIDGLEWNVRVSSQLTPEVFSKLESTFESYWNSDIFSDYDPQNDEHRTQFAQQIKAANPKTSSSRRYLFRGLDVNPYPYQDVMLESLQASRHQGHHRNLIVAATGTGKTVIAAFDYRRLHKSLGNELGRPPRTLFVAHRQEILEQAQGTFSTVMKDSDLGFLPNRDLRISQITEHNLATYSNIVFTTIQSMHKAVLNRFDRHFFDIIIIDEFHHAQAKTYRALIDHFKPRELLGLTATPERGDGVNVANEFFDGRTASELRLWDALEESLLCPFHYYVTADGTDLSNLSLRTSEYNTRELSHAFTGNTRRVDVIVHAIYEYVLDPDTMRALCFCVDIAHAQFMAFEFQKRGFRCSYVTSRENAEARELALDDLRKGKLQILCVVDLFNEGVDIPKVDTILMLRPTQSPVIFLQQLGRGLRLAEGKTILTVLDFVGNQAKGFRFDLKLRNLTQTTYSSLEKGVKEGFSHLPPGCHIQLDQRSQEIVLKSIQENLKIKVDKIPEEIRQFAATHGITKLTMQNYPLHQYLTDAQREIGFIYSKNDWQKRKISWEMLLHYARSSSHVPLDEFEDIRGRFHAFRSVADPERIAAYERLLRTDTPYQQLDDMLKLYAHMLIYSIWPTGRSEGKQFSSIDDRLHFLRANPKVVTELTQIMRHAYLGNKHVFERPRGPLGDTPLKIGAKYTREELLAALKVGFEFKSPPPGNQQEGVKFCPNSATDALLVTLVKSETHYSPQTLYRDYAVTETLFHWESQNATHANTETGQRYINHDRMGTNVALFIREHKVDGYGLTIPYTFVGPVHFVKYGGGKPMQIIWELEHPLPPDLFIAARAAAS